MEFKDIDKRPSAVRESVDIATEWNLKFYIPPIINVVPGRYSNRMEFKGRCQFILKLNSIVDIATEWNLKPIAFEIFYRFVA